MEPLSIMFMLLLIHFILYVAYFTVGRFCEYRNTAGDRSGEFTSFDKYVDTLTLECDAGESGTFTWTPDESTPDTVYYQVNCGTKKFSSMQNSYSHHS